MEENTEMVVKENSGNVMSFEDLRKESKTQCRIYTNITDRKKLFNLESKVDNLLNDCENELIRVKGVLLKIYKKPLENPIINDETGEIEKEYETTMSCVLVDDNGVSYATGSKMFALQLSRYIQSYGLEEFENEGLEIRITKNKMAGSNNKALGFELV